LGGTESLTRRAVSANSSSAAWKRVTGLTASLARIEPFLGSFSSPTFCGGAAVRQALPETMEAIVSLLANEYPLVRYFARHSLERRFGKTMNIGMSLPGRDLEQAGRAWLAATTFVEK